MKRNSFKLVKRVNSILRKEPQETQAYTRTSRQKYKTIRMQGTVNENAASIRRICQRSNQPKIQSTIRRQGLTTA